MALIPDHRFRSSGVYFGCDKAGRMTLIVPATLYALLVSFALRFPDLE